MARLPSATWELPPELAERPFRQMVSDTVDGAILEYRSGILPRHFTREALTRYPEEYRFACPGPSPKNKTQQLELAHGAAMSAYLKALGPEGRRNYYAAWRQRQRERLMAETLETRGLVSQGSRERSRDRKNEVPLFDTGALKMHTLRGSASITGTPQRRLLGLDIPLPYLHVKRRNWKGGFLDKVKALQASSPDESEWFAGRVETTLARRFAAL